MTQHLDAKQLASILRSAFLCTQAHQLQAADMLEAQAERVRALEEAINSALAHCYGEWPPILRAALTNEKESQL